MADSVLQICNEMLLNAGADIITTIANSRQGVVASYTLKDAIEHVCSHHHWPFMQHMVAAESWQEEVATIPERAVEILFVRNNYVKVQQVSTDTFYSRSVEPSKFVSGSSYPSGIYARLGHRTYAFDPYPDNTDADAKMQIRFHARVMPSITLADDFEPDIPYDVLSLIKLYGSALLSYKLTGDGSQFIQLYERNLTQTRARYSMENSINQDAIA